LAVWAGCLSLTTHGIGHSDFAPVVSSQSDAPPAYQCDLFEEMHRGA